MTAEFILQVLTAICVGAGVYAGIKSDIATTREKANNAEKSASLAHSRIDGFLTWRK